MIEIETQLRLAIRDAVNRPSRKPFQWGGLAGYQQLEGIAQALQAVPAEDNAAYLLRLASQVNRVVNTNRLLAEDVAAAHAELTQIAACLRYPPSAFPASRLAEPPVTSDLVRREMDALLEQFQPDLKRQPAQAALASAGRRLWQTCGADLLPCYNLPGLPPDNLNMETLFGDLRNQQRRISGRKSTQPLRDFGLSQVLFEARAKQSCCSNSNTCLRRIIRSSASVWRRRKNHARISIASIGIRRRPPIVSSSNMRLDGLN